MMEYRFRGFFLLTLLAVSLPASSPSFAHFIILLPGSPAVRARDQAAGEIVYGHPFEHELLDMVDPESLKITTPDGSVLDLTSQLTPKKKIDFSKKRITCYRFQFKPDERGDYLIDFSSKPRREHDEGYLKDLVKVVLHVQGERGWDRAVGHPLEILPLTRPYGLRSGSIFTARVVLEGKPLEGESVEIERYNSRPPMKLPETEFITRSLRSGPGGLIAATLDEPGWWAISVSKVHGVVQQGERDFPLILRATIWVYVGEPLLPER